MLCSKSLARRRLRFSHARVRSTTRRGKSSKPLREEDVQEMLIQNILTEDIFAKVFKNPEFHRQNSVAAALSKIQSLPLILLCILGAAGTSTARRI